MRPLTLIRRNLAYYWRTNLAVVIGVAIAVSVLAGAAVVGESVRGSLRDLVLNRLGATESVITSASFFREALTGSFPSACPLIAMEGLVIHDRGRASRVAVYGVDERFWRFHGYVGKAPAGREILLSPALAGTASVVDIANIDADQFAIGYIHHLSKRTALYTSLAFIDNGSLSRVRTSSNPNLSVASRPFGERATGFEVGLNHRF